MNCADKHGHIAMIKSLRLL